MEASYTWHPGARCLAPRWPLTPPILPDELFSSWLVRAARAHGCLPHTLTSVVWPGSRAWICDLDRVHPWTDREVLASVTGLSAQALLSSTLWPIVQLLHPNPLVKRTSNLPWILPLGCRSRSHAGGLLCCPLCIAEPLPFYRQQYRLAWHTACPWHRVLLIDRCPRCYAALQPGRLRNDQPLSCCHHCGHSLGSVAPEPAIESAMAFQAFVDAASQSATFYGRVPLSFSEWMYIARVMISFLKNIVRQPTTGSRHFCHVIGVDLSQLKLSSLGLPFEYATPAERAGVLSQAWVIMQAGPERFLELAVEAGLPANAISLSNSDTPEVLMQIVSALRQHPPHKLGRQGSRDTRTPLEVWRMWNRLQRRTYRNGLP